MTEKQITPAGLTNTGWRKVDEMLARANKEQIKMIMLKCAEKLPGEDVTLIFNTSKER